ncbi:hypothetical protein BKA70DRAFT_1399280 [Coprinopsis sp. MPI-PUGE-AT-0042]|nr:hypothetical protein BKA70DRAFT_1399280 [Coprinopsis sp. MPI-PUGE-AT-0042]
MNLGTPPTLDMVNEPTDAYGRPQIVSPNRLSSTAQSPAPKARRQAEQDEDPPHYDRQHARSNQEVHLRGNRNQEEAAWKTVEAVDASENDRRPQGLMRSGRDAKRQRDWLKMFPKVFPWAVRRARATRECIRKLRNSRTPSNEQPELASTSSAPLSSLSVGRELPPAIDAAPLTNPETNSPSPSYPSSPDQLHPPDVIPVSMSAAAVTALFQGVAQANVHGGTFNLILVNPTYHNYAPNGFAPPYPAPPPASSPP